MLNKSTIKTRRNEQIESNLPAKLPADYQNLLSSLDEGWKIIDVAFIQHNIAKTYQLMLFHPHKRLVRQVSVAPSPDADIPLWDKVTTKIDRYEQVDSQKTH